MTLKVNTEYCSDKALHLASTFQVTRLGYVIESLYSADNQVCLSDKTLLSISHKMLKIFYQIIIKTLHMLFGRFTQIIPKILII